MERGFTLKSSAFLQWRAQGAMETVPVPYIYIYLYIYKYIYTYLFIHIYIHTYIHTHIHTNKYTYLYVLYIIYVKWP